MAKRMNFGNLPPQRKKETVIQKEPEPVKSRYNKVDHSLAGKYQDQEKRIYDVIVSYCKHKDGIDEWLEWCPDKGPFKNRVFMPIDEEILRKRTEAGELTKIA